MKPAEFVAKWSRIQLKETAVYVSHFEDLCRLVGHKTPLEYDPGGENFSFQMATAKTDGRTGFADVFFRGHFILEYKGPHDDLNKAYRQLQLYRESLDNPPLLITSDIREIHIHTNFTNRPTVTTVVTLGDIAPRPSGAAGPGVEVLRRVFFDPDSFMPEKTRENITRATADTFLAVAESLRQHQRLTGEAYTPEQRAHFLIRLLFCLFAEDLGLLPDGLFTQLVKAQGKTYSDLREPLKKLFATMRGGGHFGMWAIRWFNGTLFDDEFVPTLPADLAGKVRRAAEQDWSAIDPSIFGTLFERIIDEDKRAQLGAHYTSKDDILLIVEPVLMEPLRRKWDEVRRITNYELRITNEEDGSSAPLPPFSPSPLPAYDKLVEFSNELAAVRVLDPACGSGNFLYVALRRLLDLQKEVIAFAARRGLPEIPLTVGPEQLYGIEINEYAHELAQVTAWIGYLQWRHENGFDDMADPVLRPLGNIKRMDAILAWDEAGNPVEPEWPAAEVIVGNPPFLGHKKQRIELGAIYAEEVRALYSGRLDGRYDLVCLWFEKARTLVENGSTKRVGLLATNSIRKGASNEVLRRIAKVAPIFLAWADRPWILDGAAVRVSMIGFGIEHVESCWLDGARVSKINPDLTSEADLTEAQQLQENTSLAFIGTQRTGPFEITKQEAARLLADNSNKNGRPNSDVVRPWINASDLTRRPSDMWIVDFGVNMTLSKASEYVLPFEHVFSNVKPVREAKPNEALREKWWLFWCPRPEMRTAISNLKRYIATPISSKHRVFVWQDPNVVAENTAVVIAREDDYFFGVLSSRIHELWALGIGNWLGKGNDPRYTPTTTFETFPFPWPPGEEPGEGEKGGKGEGEKGGKGEGEKGGKGEGEMGSGSVDQSSVDGSLLGGSRADLSGPELVAEIARWARALVDWREAWLNPPPPARGTLDVAWERLIKARTLTNLYNGLVYWREHKGPAFDRAAFDKETRKSVTPAEIQELDDIHRALDAAVFRAYGWPEDLSDEAILERLLALNLERSDG